MRKGGGMKQPEGVACGEKDLSDRWRYRKTIVFSGIPSRKRSLKAGTEIKIPQLSNPIRLQINSKGEIFALDGKKRRIIRLNPDGTFKGYVDAEGIPSPSTFVPRSFKIDRNNNIYILDIFSGRVLVLNSGRQIPKTDSIPERLWIFLRPIRRFERYAVLNRLCQGHGFFGR